MKQRLGVHIAFWLAYLAFESYVEFAWISSSYEKLPQARRFLMALGAETTFLLLKVPLVYFIFFVVYKLSPRFRNIWIPCLVGLAGFGMALVIHRFMVIKFILPVIYREGDLEGGLFNLNRVISSLLDLLFVLIAAIVAKQYRQKLHWKEREKNLVKERLEAELKFLRTQTNPHFLFNTLNNIYALARKKSDDTADVVMKLSKLLRFMLYESKKETISIADEIRVLDDYIELEKIRYNNRLRVDFIKSVDTGSTPIAPLILLPFVENAFKHGASEARFDTFIALKLEVKNGQLNFRVENSKDEDGSLPIVENIGLSNVRRQLELMYPDHQLKLMNEKNKFAVHLTLNLLNYATV